MDPLDAVWLAVARGFGLRVSRSSEVYAATDGRGSLVLGEEATLDADDCLAQMIFHELCHACVQGPDNLMEPDWGLDNESARDVEREHACLRLQAALAGTYGLREVLAPTTDYRVYYDALPDDPMAGDEASAVLARAAALRAAAAPFHDAFAFGLAATRDVLASVARVEAHFGASDEALLHRLLSRS